MAQEPSEANRRGRHRRSRGGRSQRQARPDLAAAAAPAYITRKISYYTLLDEEGLEAIETHAETILQEIGIEFRGDDETLDLWRAAGADAQAAQESADALLPALLSGANFVLHAAGRLEGGLTMGYEKLVSRRKASRPDAWH